MKPTEETGLLIRYLLGDVSEAEQVQVEEQFFADEDKHQQLLALEDELRYDYAQGGLSGRQRGLFEKRFLPDPAERQKVELAKAVLQKTFEQAALRKVQPVAKPSWRRRFVEFFESHPVASLASAAAVTAVICAAVLVPKTVQLRQELADLRVRLSDEKKAAQVALNEQQSRDETLLRDLEKERSRREQLEQDSSKGRRAPFVLAFALAPGLVRGAEGPKRLRVPPEADSVQLKLDLDAGEQPGEVRASLQNLDGQELWSQDVRATSSSATLAVPARVLPPGDYLVELQEKGTGERARSGEYYFTIVR